MSVWSDFFRNIGRALLLALQFAHARRFTHRDLKPSNVLVTDRGVSRLADFGVAKLHAFIEPGITLAGFAIISSCAGVFPGRRLPKGHVDAGTLR